MTSIETARRWQYPLYIFAKPPLAKHLELTRLRARFGIESGYAIDRAHNTFLPLGEATDASIAAARQILETFRAEPFDVVFDHIEGNTLKPRKGQRAPGILQRSLARHFAVSGWVLPEYNFGLHLNLDYGNPSNRRAAIEPFGYTVGELLLVESMRGHIVHGRRSLAVRQYALAL